MSGWLVYFLVIVLTITVIIFIGKINKLKNYPNCLKENTIDFTIKPQSENVKKLMTFVDNAANLISQNGEKAYLEFRKPNTAWWNGDSYVFVYDLSGKTLVLPPTPNIEGINRMNVKDAAGNYYVKDMINVLKNKDFGWISYVYPKPGESSPSAKLSYFKKVNVNGKPVLVGSGIYLE